MILLLGDDNLLISKLILEISKEQNVPCLFLNENNFNEIFIRDEIVKEECNITWETDYLVLNFSSLSGILNLLHFPLKLITPKENDDTIFFIEQFISYLSFALNGHPNVYNKPKNGNVNSNLFSITHYWEYLSSKKIPVPKWGYTSHFLSSLSKTENLNIIYSDNLFDYNNWTTANKKRDSLIYYVRPSGYPILVSFIDSFFVLSKDISNYNDRILNVIEELKYFEINFGELLLFYNDETLTFGRFSPLPQMENYPIKEQRVFAKHVFNKLSIC